MIFFFPSCSSSLTLTDGVLPYVGYIWICLTVTALLLHAVLDCKSYFPTLVTDMIEYGKLREHVTTAAAGRTISFLNVPKRWFTHFYVWGSLWILSITLVYYNTCLVQLFKHVPILDDIINVTTGNYIARKCRTIAVQQEHVDVAVVLGMLSVQVAKRLYECLCVSVFSDDARMHLVHYFLGLFYYPAVAFTALLHLQGVDSTNYQTTQALSSVSLLRWYHLACLCLYLWATYHQYVCHKILADLRGGRTGKNGNVRRNGYSRPDGDWFGLVSSPHYLAEILIYLAPLLCFMWRDLWTCWWLVVVYVVSSLTVSARQGHCLYLSKFANYPAHRRVIFPWLY